MSWTGPTTRATGDVITAAIWNTDIVNNLLYLHGDSGLVAISNEITTQGMRVHRHPYGAARHIESGVVLITTGGSSWGSASASFTDAFGSAPTVMATLQWFNGGSGMTAQAAASSITTTGCTVNGQPGASWTNQPVGWIAEGAD